MAEAIYIAGFYVCFVWAIKQHLVIRVLRRDMNAADERISRYRMAVDEIDKWCGHESAEARLIAAFISASGEGRGMNAGTPREIEVCDISGTRDQLRRLKLATQADERDAIRELIAKHRVELENNAYAYFELAYTRRTSWMAWITDKPLNSGPVINPDRRVLARGQGETPEEACADAIATQTAAQGEQQ